MHTAEDRKVLNLRCADVSAMISFASVAILVALGFAIFTSFFFDLNPRFFGTTTCMILNKESVMLDNDAFCALKLNVTYYTLEQEQVFTHIYACIYESLDLCSTCSLMYNENSTHSLMYRFNNISRAALASEITEIYESTSSRLWFWVAIYLTLGSVIWLSLLCLRIFAFKIARFKKFFDSIWPGIYVEPYGNLSEVDTNYQITFAQQEDFIGSFDNENQKLRQARELTHYIDILSRTARLPSEIIYWHSKVSLLRSILGVYTLLLIVFAITIDAFVMYLLRGTILLYLCLPIFAYTIIMVHVPIRALFQYSARLLVTNNRIVIYGRRYYQHYEIKYIYHDEITEVKDLENNSGIEITGSDGSSSGIFIPLSLIGTVEKKNELVRLFNRMRTGSENQHSLESTEQQELPYAPTVVDFDS